MKKQNERSDHLIRERYGEDFEPSREPQGIYPVEIHLMKHWKKSNSIKNHSFRFDPVLALGQCVYIALNENSNIKEVTLILYKDNTMRMLINAAFILPSVKSAFTTALEQQDLGYTIAAGFDPHTPHYFNLSGTREEMAKLLLALKLFQTTLDDEFIRDVCDEAGGIEHLIYPRDKKEQPESVAPPQIPEQNQFVGVATQIAASSSHSPIFTRAPSPIVATASPSIKRPPTPS